LNPFWFLKRNSAAKGDKPSDDDKSIGLLAAHERASESHRLSEQGAYRDSNAVLEALLADLERAHGPAVDEMRAKLLGLAGTNYFHLGAIDRSRAFTVKALEESRRVRDEIGVRTYVANLRFLNSQPASKDARMIDLEFDLLKKLDRSQRLSDQSRCKESNELLESILRAKEFDLAVMMDRYRGKIHGLMGQNNFILGDHSMARRCTEAAIQDCRHCGDEDGVRVYTHNLGSITQAAR
jgi:hypothetical protein